MPTQEFLKKHLTYDSASGVFTRPDGSKAGGIHGASGYERISIYNRRYYSHRLAWIYHYGEVPKNIDHINGVKHDNRIANLRSVGQSENQHNRFKQKNSTSGYRGVSYHADNKKWIAQIMVNRQNKYLGSFKTAEEAFACRLKYEQENAILPVRL